MALTEAQRIAQQKWREKNKERVREKNKEAFQKWYKNNKEKHNERALRCYHNRQKQSKALTEFDWFTRFKNSTI